MYYKWILLEVNIVTLGIKFTELLSKNTAEAISVNKLDFYNNL